MQTNQSDTFTHKQLAVKLTKHTRHNGCTEGLSLAGEGQNLYNLTRKWAIWTKG